MTIQLSGFYTFGYIDGRSAVIFVPCLQVTVPAITVLVREL